MEGAKTTEELFSTLGPLEREEAIRIAARLQTHGQESESLVAAAREAGIEDRFLRQAIEKLRPQKESARRSEWTSSGRSPIRSVLPVLAMVMAIGLFVGSKALDSGETGNPVFRSSLFGLSAASLAVGLALPAEFRRWKAAQYVFMVLAGIGLLCIGIRLLGDGPMSAEVLFPRAAFLVLGFASVAYMGALLSGMFHALRDALKRSTS